MDHELIAEEENDGSSFLVAEREAQQVIEEEVTDDGRSQVSQNLMGAHLISNQDLYPFRGGSAFQTPKPIKDDIQGAQNSRSPMTSYRKEVSSNIHPRQDLL